MIDKTDVRLVLKRDMFEYVINVLAQRPYAEVAATIAEFGRQASAPPAEVVPLQSVAAVEKESTK